MAYNSLISRSSEQALVPEVVSDDILANLQYSSAAFSLFKQIPMSTNVTRMPVLSALPLAYFVGGDTGLKQTTQMAWSNKFLNVEEIAVIVPIPVNVVDDTAFDLWGYAKPLLQEAASRTLDAAIFFGVNKPGSWPADITSGAVAAGNVIVRGTNAPANGGLAGDLSNLFGTVEADGYDVNGLVQTRTYKGFLRNARTTFGEQYSELSADMVYGVKPTYPMRGLWPTGSGVAEAIAGDFSDQGILGVRKDFTWDMFREGVIQDGTGAIVYNLLQQDMVALRMTLRVAFQVANTINYDQQTESVRYPFAVMKSP